MAMTHTPEIDATRRRGYRRRIGLLPATVAGLSLVLAACGSSGPSVAHLPGGAKTSPSAQSGSPGEPAAGGGSGGSQQQSATKIAGVSGAGALKFAACVRSHGVPNFPDPNAQGVFTGNRSITGTPQFQSASHTCQSLLHLGGGPPSPARQAQALASLLKYSQCMRSHGVPRFPDPTTSPGGGASLSLSSHDGTGIDSNSPIFQRAQQACQNLQTGSPGAAK